MMHVVVVGMSLVFRSVLLCRLGPQVITRTYEGAEHTEILTNNAAVADLLNILHEDYAPSILERLANICQS